MSIVKVIFLFTGMALRYKFLLRILNFACSSNSFFFFNKMDAFEFMYLLLLGGESGSLCRLLVYIFVQRLAWEVFLFADFASSL